MCIIQRRRGVSSSTVRDCRHSESKWVSGHWPLTRALQGRYITTTIIARCKISRRLRIKENIRANMSQKNLTLCMIQQIFIWLYHSKVGNHMSICSSFLDEIFNFWSKCLLFFSLWQSVDWLLNIPPIFTELKSLEIIYQLYNLERISDEAGRGFSFSC